MAVRYDNNVVAVAAAAVVEGKDTRPWAASVPCEQHGVVAKTHTVNSVSSYSWLRVIVAWVNCWVLPCCRW